MHTYLISCDILFYRMMQRQADKAGRKVAFLDPLAIVEKRHKGPMFWDDDHDEFKNYKSRKEINEVRKREHRNIITIVATYISNQFQEWQDRDVIWAPYNFRQV